MITEVKCEIGGRELSFETGRVAKQADGAVWVRYGGTVIIATVCASKESAEDRDFFPLTVDFREKTFAGGKIPGGFFKREGRPSEKEVLSGRMIDRPIRPLFPEGFFNEVQILITVLSSDQENEADQLGINGASAALAISPIPAIAAP
jgi:polyribonucleotide nucleotidyltransferase